MFVCWLRSMTRMLCICIHHYLNYALRWKKMVNVYQHNKLARHNRFVFMGLSIFEYVTSYEYTYICALFCVPLLLLVHVVEYFLSLPFSLEIFTLNTCTCKNTVNFRLQKELTILFSSTFLPISKPCIRREKKERHKSL